jgi:hypothetical protein
MHRSDHNLVGEGNFVEEGYLKNKEQPDLCTLHVSLKEASKSSSLRPFDVTKVAEASLTAMTESTS